MAWKNTWKFVNGEITSLAAPLHQMYTHSGTVLASCQGNKKGGNIIYMLYVIYIYISYMFYYLTFKTCGADEWKNSIHLLCL